MQTVTAVIRKKTARKHPKIGIIIPGSMYGDTESTAYPFAESGPKVTEEKHTQQYYKQSKYQHELSAL